MVVEDQLHLVFGGRVLNHREAKADRRVVIILGVLVASYVVNDGLVAVKLFILEGNIQSSLRIEAFLIDEAHCRFVHQASTECFLLGGDYTVLVQNTYIKIQGL